MWPSAGGREEAKMSELTQRFLDEAVDANLALLDNWPALVERAKTLAYHSPLSGWDVLSVYADLGDPSAAYECARHRAS
jgi:hypothetical protein